MKIKTNVTKNRPKQVLDAVFLLGSCERSMNCRDINERDRFMRAMQMYNQTWRKSYKKEKKEPEPAIKEPVYNWYSGIFLGMREV